MVISLLARQLRWLDGDGQAKQVGLRDILGNPQK